MTKAIVFSGCGALGSWQAGAASVLASRDGYPDHYYGVSSGSLNAFLFSYFGALKASEFWYEIDSFSQVFTPNYFRLLFADGVFHLNKKLKKQFLHDLKSREFPSTSMSVWTMGVKDGESKCHTLLRGQIHNNRGDIACASISIPGVVESHAGEVDAGYRLLAPLAQAIRDGHDEIILISGRPVNAPTVRPRLIIPAAAAAYQAVDVALSEILRRDINECLYRNTILGFRNINLKIIQPEVVQGGPLDFDECKDFLKSGRYQVTSMIQRGLI